MVAVSVAPVGAKSDVSVCRSTGTFVCDIFHLEEISEPLDWQKSSSSSLITMKEASHTFITQLHKLLENEDASVVTWNEKENGFHILDVEKFETIILPQYYRHSKLTSFQRQLNLYGFKKMHHGVDFGAYIHPKFTRDDISSLIGIK